jgi:CubicO group peptidase (beta-lactamase class C family)
MRSKIVLFSIFIITACGGGSDGNSTNNDPNGVATPEPATTVQDVLDDAVKNGIDGIFVYIEQSNKINESYVSGLQDKVTQLPADANSLFKIASISKLFIAVSAVKVIAQEQLSLNDTLASLLPELADRIENSNTITVEYLIQHRSGIADFDSQTGFDWQNAHIDIDRTLLYALDKPADFPPDSQYEYSNTNYLLLAKILDKALGYSHQVYIRENILNPLDMNNTYLSLSEIDMSLLVKGYWDNIERSMQDYVIPGGSMISNVKDIAIFIRALNTGTLLTPSEKNIYSSVYWFNHSGWLPGYQSIASFDKQKDTVVVQFINTTGGNSEAIASSSNELIFSLIAN